MLAPLILAVAVPAAQGSFTIEADKHRGEIVMDSGATFAILERMYGTREGVRLGARMADAHDFDGDGHLELMVSEPCFAPRTSSTAGDLVNGHAPGKVYGLYPHNWTGGASD